MRANKGITEDHYRAATIVVQKARNALSQLRSKALAAEWDHSPHTWRDQVEPVYDALSKTTAIFGMLRDYNALISPDLMVEEMKEIVEEQKVVGALARELDEHDKSEKDLVEKIAGVNAALARRASDLRVMFAPRRYRSLDERVEHEMAWANEKPLVSLDRACLLARSQTLSELAELSIAIYGWEDQTVNVLTRLRKEYSDALSQNREAEEDWEKERDTDAKSAAVNRLFDRYCAEADGS